MELIAKGAESNLYKDGEILIKERLKKDYRITEIDEKLRKKRTLGESKILQKLKGELNVPEVIRVDDKNFKIFMKFMGGSLMKDLVKKDKEQTKRELKDIAVQLGKQIAKMHRLNVIHNDLTTSNIIISSLRSDISKAGFEITNGEEKKVYLIDFGLSYVSQRTEDKATDLVVLEHSLNATGIGFLAGDVIEGYKNIYEECNDKKADEIFKRMKEVKKRVRYFEEENV
ncbi:MAG: Kae1-associated serine/threonine protein kinase [Candidatus Altiarchaeum hamiconexum]|uniref:non-specific serine/threonine protein kinase n=1 Tax=Candidatus Altarchaeum hamiconexum TaxID=1803513 RepID=A0A8J8CFD3_9ARCH|nr:Kae1-associated serine/threonine protein kinase [Candidatus Altarchaeum hamiconexum]NCN69484.1 Kae1-associated serine/threonine protein kinase [Candidatus Altarchaeum hamiconexum]NCS91535.1 Kae1-associated serine/threonine protein kinase [Candidatus Altarchaeum hamiconexum]NCT01608.1 Kae1-associated serine/threonine protein kinase [Candidatus Altarchaeum hamiconexum]